MDMNQGTSEQAASANGHPAAETAAPKKYGKIDVNAMLFKAARECQSSEETRYYLNGVYVQPHPERGALLVATNGHRLIAIHDETGVCEKPAIVHVHTKAFAGIKIEKKKPEIPRLYMGEDGHVIVGCYRSIEPAPIDGTYPDYARVLLPIVDAINKGVWAPASYNHEYLAAWSRVAGILTDGRRSIRIISTGESDPSLILFDGAPHAFGVLMPMRATMQNGMPEFMQPVLEPLRKPKPAAAPAAAPTAAPTKRKRAAAKKPAAKERKKKPAKVAKKRK